MNSYKLISVIVGAAICAVASYPLVINFVDSMENRFDKGKTKLFLWSCAYSIGAALIFTGGLW